MALVAPRTDQAHDLTAAAHDAATAVEALMADATLAVRDRVTRDGEVSAAAIDREQRAAHGLAWLGTYVEAIRQLAAYADRMAGADRFGEAEELLVRIGLGEYLAQMLGGIPMSQGEMVRPSDLGLSPAQVATRLTPAVEDLIQNGNIAANRARLIELMRAQPGATVGDCGLDDVLDAMRDEIRRFADSEVAPHAHDWHLANRYIPLEIIAHMGELGVFGLTIPETFGGMGLGKESMCVVSEELSRAYIGVGSL